MDTTSAKEKINPRLRFPEFQDVGNWDREILENVAELFKGKGLPKSEIIENGDIQCIHYGELFTVYSEVINKVVSHTRTRADAFLSLPNDVLMPTSDVTPSGLAKASCIKLKDVILGGDILVIRPNDKSISGEFIARQIRYLEKEVLKLVSGTTVFHLYPSSVKKLEIFITDGHEQQKIADCLSSIDELISVEARKLDALKAHKKGLMQQLFPAEGETAPRLRFPEFRDAGEWQKKNLIDLSEGGFSNGVFNDPKKVGYGYRLINVLDMYLDKSIDENLLSLVGIDEGSFLKNKVEHGDIFFTRSSIVPAGIAASNIYLGFSEKITYDGHLIRLRPKKELVFPLFLHYLLKSKYVRTQLVAKGKTAAMTTIGQADVGSTTVLLPLLSEQRKIADCLSSIDDLILEKIRTLDSLKCQKKGLMQQLFPVMDEIQG